MTRLRKLVLVAALLSACAGPSAEVRRALGAGAFDEALAAYEQAPSPGLLASIAEALLEREALGSDARWRDGAFGALAASGTHARDVLERLAASSATSVRARALALLGRLGDPAARHALFGYVESDDAEARAAAVETLDPDRDRNRLVRRLDDPDADVRRAAVRALGRASEDAPTRLALERTVRHDPASDVRAAAVGALALQGGAAVPAIEARLADAERAVRFAAIAALLTVDSDRALGALDRSLASDPSPEGVEAARLVLTRLGASAPVAARAQLARALGASDEALRAQAAVALSTLGEDDLARARIGVERARAVCLSLALALGVEDAGARQVLAALMAGTDVVAGQAASTLARRGDDTAREKLLALRSSRSAAVRRTVARTLGRDLGRIHDVREALVDADVSVRIAAAAAILVGAD